jgi:Bacterial SH3 domain
MKHLIGCIALFLSGICPVVAQYTHPILQYKPNDTTYVFGEHVNLRADSTTTAKVVVQLNPGEKVIITGQSESLLTLNQRTEHWYKVNVPGQKTSGYIWGGMLSILAATKGDMQFLLNQVQGAKPDKPAFEIRAVSKNTILHKITVPEFPCGEAAMGEYLMSATVDGNHGLPGCQNIIHFSSSLETGMCDVIGADMLLSILWNGKTLQPLPMIARGRGPGCVLGSFYGSSYIFPSDPGGKPDLVLKMTLSGDCDDDDEEAEYTKTITVRKVLKWNGARYVTPKRGDED